MYVVFQKTSTQYVLVYCETNFY